MSVKYFDIDSNSLNVLLKAKKFSHAKIALSLGVSPKTIQRWINGTSKHIRAEDLQKLVEILSVDSSLIIKSDSDCLRVRPCNLLVQTITSEEYLLRVRINDDWTNYIKALRSITLDELPNHQEVCVLKCLGVSYLATGSFQSAKENLEKAKTKALNLDCDDLLAIIYLWLARYEYLYGSFKKYFECLDLGQVHFYKIENKSIRISYYLLKGRILLLSDKFEECAISLRTGIRLAYKNPHENLLKISLAYPYLGWLYLRRHQYMKALSAFEKSIELAKMAGWVEGVSVAELAIAIIEAIKSRKIIPDHNLKKYKRFSPMINVHRVDSRFQQLQFVYYVLKDNYKEADKFLCIRKAETRSAIQLAYLTLDSLFIMRLSGNKNEIDPAEIKQAKNIFDKNEMNSALQTLNWLLSVSHIDQNNFLDYHTFY